MQNNFRYDKLNMLIHLQHQRSHYRRIIEAKKCIEFQNQLAVHPRQSLSTRQKNQLQARPQPHLSQPETGLISRSKQVYKRNANKYNKQIQRQRKENNIKLVNKIGEINKQSGILETMYHEAQDQSSRKNVSINASYKRIQDHRIMNDNAKFAQRLVGVKPAVGTVSQWKMHYKNFKNAEKRIQRNNSYDPQLQLRKTISSLTGNNPDHFFNSSKRRKTSISQSSRKSIRPNNDNSENSEYSLIKTLEDKLTLPKDLNKKQERRTLKQRIKTQKSEQERLKKDTKYLSTHLNARQQGQFFKYEVNTIVRKDDDDQRDLVYQQQSRCAIYKGMSRDRKNYRSLSNNKATQLGL